MAPSAHRDPLTKSESREVAENIAGESSPLLTATAAGYTGVVALLLRDPRVDPAEAHQGARALVIACRNGRDGIVPMLLRDPRVDMDRAAPAALRAARRRGDAHLVAMLMRNPRVRAHADTSDDAPLDGTRHLGRFAPEAAYNVAAARLVAAAAVGRTAAVRRLLRDPVVDPAAGESRALRVAAAGGHWSAVAHLLVDGRADPAARDSEALRTAVILGHVPVVRMLLCDGRADPMAGHGEIVLGSHSRGMLRVLRGEPRLARYYDGRTGGVTR